MLFPRIGRVTFIDLTMGIGSAGLFLSQEFPERGLGCQGDWVALLMSLLPTSVVVIEDSCDAALLNPPQPSPAPPGM